MFVDNPVKHYEALARYWRRIGEFGIAQRMSARAEEFRKEEKRREWDSNPRGSS